MSTLKVNEITNAAGTGAPNFSDGLKYNGAALSTLNTYEYTSSATEPSNPSNGALWWDSANAQAKIYVNNSWKTVTLEGVDSTPAAFIGDRGVFINGRYFASSTYYSLNIIDYIDITTTGNATDFGDTSYGVSWESSGGASNGTRGVFTAGNMQAQASVQTPYSNDIHYITISTPSNSVDFGDLTVANSNTAGTSNGTYGLFWQGITNTSGIDYVTIATTSNASDFGDSNYTEQRVTGASGKTRNFAYGGPASSHDDANNNYGQNIQYVTVATPSNALDFGDLTSGADRGGSASDNTRSVLALGLDNITGSTVYSNVLCYITQDTTGNATDFGDLTVGRWGIAGCSNATRGVFAGGNYGATFTNTIDYITIQTTGNAADFGDMTNGRYVFSSLAGNPS